MKLFLSTIFYPGSRFLGVKLILQIKIKKNLLTNYQENIRKHNYLILYEVESKAQALEYNNNNIESTAITRILQVIYKVNVMR